MAIELSLAPLAGFTDAPFRRLCGEFGADLAYTEMVSAAGLRHGSEPTKALMAKMPGEGPLACQIFGADELDVAHAARVAEGRGFVELNLNAGCPMPKVTRCGAGAKLMDDPARIARLLSAMRENTSLPVTLKTRLGPRRGETRIFEIVDAAAASGAAKIIVHARYASQMHGGETHLDVLREVVSKSPVPVVGNGSVTDLASLREMESTGVAGIMIGRAALARPWIFSLLKAGTSPEVAASSLCEKHLELLLEFRDMLEMDFPRAHIPDADAFAALKMRTHLCRYFNGQPGAAKLRARLNSVRTVTEIRQISFSPLTV